MDNPAIQTQGLRKIYGTKVAVADLTLEVPRAEVFGFLGPNGAGKSTAVKMLLGLVKPSGGDASMLDHPQRHSLEQLFLEIVGAEDSGQ
jgi:ABC-2 type transport system ATP-binding protein